jgi:hypothetical protein
MRIFITRFCFIIISLSSCITELSQENTIKSITTGSVIDSLKNSGVIFNNNQKKPEIALSTNQALKFLQERTHPNLWNDPRDPLRTALARLIYQAAHPIFDSSKYFLQKYPYDSLSIPWDKFYIWEPLRLKIPVISVPEFNATVESGVLALKDTTIMVIIDTLNEVTSSYPQFPFKYFDHPFLGDSIQAAVRSLLNYLDERDSTVISFSGIGKDVIPVWMNSRTGKVMRYWLKNEFSDSVTIWIGNPSRNTIGLYLEQGVSFRRPIKQTNYSNAKVNVKALDNSKLLILKNVAFIPKKWKYHTESSLVLNQASLSNWVRGGESSISTALDITGYANYKNTALKLSSENFARIKFGYIALGKEEIRKNLDLLETNSKLNHKAFGKFDFSAILLFKTQLARGYNYTKNAQSEDTSILVSKFMNPAILTIGLGLDYKPDETTSLNFSPLSYKGTFVTDPAYYHNTYDPTRIDQTNYGIAKNRKSLNEPGVSFMITKMYKPTKSISIINRLQLFTNYIHNPQNVDVDWEMIAVANLNWFTDVRFNTHLIFDDDTKTTELYKNGNPVLRPDGTEKKTARIQFKQMLGFSLSFRF